MSPITKKKLGQLPIMMNISNSLKWIRKSMKDMRVNLK